MSDRETCVKRLGEFSDKSPECAVFLSPCSFDYVLRFGFMEDGDVRFVSTGGIEFEENRVGEVFRSPGIVLRGGMGQKIMDELWRVGVRPTNFSGYVSALKDHLEDARKAAGWTEETMSRDRGPCVREIVSAAPEMWELLKDIVESVDLAQIEGEWERFLRFLAIRKKVER